MKSQSLPKSFFLTVLLFCGGNHLYSQENLPAFPSAEGYGKYTTGGRGGNVYEVTNTKGSGAGSFGAALKGAGPRTIVFRVSGTISGWGGTIPSATTVAGQTAPGDGICLIGGMSLSSNVILRYIRVRGPAGDNIGARDKENIILDHVSTSWCTDESVSIYHCKNVTIQWCMVTESFNPANHAFAGIWGGPNNTYHHNLLAHHISRSPRFSGGIANNDFRNNVIYNWGRNSMYGGEEIQNGGGYEGYSYINVVANYYKSGPATTPGMTQYRIVDPWKNTGYGKFYVADNYVHGYPEVTADNWDGGEHGGVQVTGNNGNNTNLLKDRSMKADEPAPFMPINQQTPEEAYKAVIKHVGCSFPNRDDLDKRIINEVETGTAKYGKNGIINNKSQSSGYGELKSTTPPADGDHDGMPDEWEKAKGLNPADAEDRNGIGEGGYTNLENYLNSLIAANYSAAKEDAGKNKLELSHGYLNPFNSSPIIKYALPAKSKVKLVVFDAAGKIVATLVDEVKAPGNYSVDFDGLHLTTGLYLCKLSAVNQSITGKMFFLN